MLPIGPLMIEHRLIERMIALLKKHSVVINEFGDVDPQFIDTAVDFIRTYADRCHHGKEEDILFRELEKKELSEGHQEAMDRLVQDHIDARNQVAALVQAKEDYLNGQDGALDNILKAMNWLVEFYPDHIYREDKVFFIPVMNYFTDEEKDKMLAEFNEFDRKLIHEKYEKVVVKLED